MLNIRRSIKIARKIHELKEENHDYFLRLLRSVDVWTWEWVAVSFNPNVRVETLRQSPELPWNYNSLSGHADVERLYTESPHKSWSWVSILYSGKLSAEFINNHLDEIAHLEEPYCWFYLSKSTPITLDDIKKYSHLPWDWKGVSRNPNISFQVIKENPNLPWDYDHVSFNPNVTPEIIRNNPDIKWNPKRKFDAPLTIDSLRKWDTHPPVGSLRYAEHMHEWMDISSNPAFTLQMMLDNPDLPWNWVYVSQNPSVTLKEILAHPEINWNWGLVSKNSSISLEEILAHPELPWSWTFISQNSNITPKQVLENPNLPWNYKKLSGNPFNAEIKRLSEVI